MESLGLLNGIGAEATVENEPTVQRCVGVFLLEDTTELFELFHKVGLGVEASGGVEEEVFVVTAAGGFVAIECDGGGVGAVMAGDNVDFKSGRPVLDLLVGGGSEGIAGS